LSVFDKSGINVLHIFKGTILLLPQNVRHCSAGTEICVGQSQSGDWTNPHSNSMGVSSTPYWTKTGKFLFKREEVWGMVNYWGEGGFAEFASKM